MSNYGELFVIEQVRDWLHDNFPNLEFDWIKCPNHLYHIRDAELLPNKFKITLMKGVDEHQSVVRKMRVYVSFYIEMYMGRRRIGAEVEKVKPITAMEEL